MGNTNRRKPVFTIWMKKKLLVLFFIVLIVFSGLGYRLYRIVKKDGEKYKKQVLSQQAYDSKPIPARRGKILDTNGTVLAASEKVYNVILDAVQMTDQKEYIEPTIRALSEKLGLNADEIRQYVKEHPDSRYYVLKKQLSFADISAFKDLTNPESKHYNKNIQGVWFEDGYRRTYPNKTLASDVIGFTTSDGNGLYGLEEYYNDTLIGTNGREYGYLDDDSNLERTVIPADDGKTVVSTIDSNLQSIAEKYLNEFNAQNENAVREGDGANNTGCIIMDVNTGAILAMASYPQYDLNDTKNTEPLIGRPLVDEKGNPVRDEHYNYEYITQENLGTLEGDLLLQQYNSLWRNYCISDTYEPGSVAKPFTVAGALEAGKITGNEVYTCQGFLEVGGHRIACHGVHNEVSVERAIEVSCNVTMMHIAEATGADTFAKFQNIFNFGLKTGIDSAGEARTQGLTYSADQLGSAELATNSFGQGFNVTMIEMISAFSSLVNGGYYYEPHLAKQIISPGGAVMKNISPRILKQTISASVSDKIKEYCKQVVAGPEGTGKTARPAGYMIGGKTGTAETLPRSTKKWYVVSFMGFAPVDHPQIAIYVVVDRPNAARQDDAKFATRIVRQILTEALPYLNIPMTEPLSDEEKAELEELKQQSLITETDSNADTEDAKDTEGTTEEGTNQSEDASPSIGNTVQTGDNGEAKTQAGKSATSSDNTVSQKGNTTSASGSTTSAQGENAGNGENTELGDAGALPDDIGVAGANETH